MDASPIITGSLESSLKIVTFIVEYSGPAFGGQENASRDPKMVIVRRVCQSSFVPPYVIVVQCNMGPVYLFSVDSGGFSRVSD